QELSGLAGIATNTTDLQQAEFARQQTEQRYAAIINDETDLVCCFNFDYQITFVTQGFCSLFDQPKVAMLGISIFDYIPSDQHADLQAALQAITLHAPSFEYDFLGVDVQNNPVWRRWLVSGTFDAAGQISEYQCVGQDFSERLFIERQLALQTQRAAALARSAALLNTTINLADVLDLIAHELSSTLNIPIVIVYLYDPAQHASVYAHSVGLDATQLALVRAIPFNLMRLRNEFRTGIQIFANPLAETWMGNHPLHALLGATRLITVELFRQQEYIGTFALISTDSAPDLDHEEQVLLRGIADLAAQAIANAQLFTAIQQLATHDALTGLYNRRYIIEQGAHALTALAAVQQAQPTPIEEPAELYVGLIYLDLDRFKQINDTLGHDVGDVTLRQIAQELQQATPADAVLGRMGGDEFAVLLPHTTKNHAASVARHILNTVNRVYTIDSHQLTLGGSIGLVLEHNPETDFVQMLTSADIAMYRAKRSGGGTRLYDSELHNEVIRSVQLAHDLQHALEGDELLIYYQPIVNIAQQSVAVVEALLRWQHPTYGLLSPGVFLPVAEEHGLMQQLDLYVIERVLHEASQWWLAGRRVGVTINLSISSIFRPDLPVWISHALRDCHLPMQEVIFELSERTVLDDFADIQRTLNALKQLGVRIALDDFGSGFGSLAYIQHLPLDMVKIDRDFTCTIGHDPRAETILHTMIGLSNSLDLLTVVEGVETTAQLNWLAQAGCVFVQGFLTGRPMPLAAVDWGQ
ncbi:MAG: EAL domain-containing protein, partial [Chloroflexaceae bacterium]|nr:EAL domain-containing protein [Chloroflexaceae bacterium]